MTNVIKLRHDFMSERRQLVKENVSKSVLPGPQGQAVRGHIALESDAMSLLNS